MNDPVRYTVENGPRPPVVFLLSPERLTVAGSPAQSLDVPLASVRHFCLLRLKRFQPTGTGKALTTATSAAPFNAELVISWEAAGKTRAKKLRVDADHPTFHKFLDTLVALRPEASLLHLHPEIAEKQMGVVGGDASRKLLVLGLVAAALVLLALLVFFGSR